VSLTALAERIHSDAASPPVRSQSPQTVLFFAAVSGKLAADTEGKQEMVTKKQREWERLSASDWEVGKCN
jgi:hypothetical protein